jgi:hypothetical protein
MNFKRLLPFLAVLPLTGCVVYSGGNRSGDVTLSWSFAGNTCNQVPHVQSVKVTIPGETLQNNGVYSCLTNNYPGIVLNNFRGGTYSYNLQALDYSGRVAYESSGTFAVNGNTRVDSDLTPPGGGASYAYLSWTFPANSASNNPTCQSAGVTKVEISIDGAAPIAYACADGQTAQGVVTPYLDPGVHTIDLWARTASNYVYYSLRSNLTTEAARPSAAQYDFVWAVGGTAINWAFQGAQSTCAASGVTKVYVNFIDSQTNLAVYPADDMQDCGGAPVLYNYLPPGTYKVRLIGTGPGVEYRSNLNPATTVTVSAGVFVDEAEAIPVTMYRM